MFRRVSDRLDLMSGKRQHFLPRFLLKGFASRRKGKQWFIWVFHAGNAPFETNIVNIGTESHFYGTPGPGTLDERLTEAESDDSNLVEKLRSGNAQALRDRQRLASLVFRLGARSRNLRQAFSDAAGRVLATITEHASHPAKAARMAREGLDANPDIMRREITRLLEEQYGRKPDRNEVARAEARFRPRLMPLIDAQANGIAALMKMFGDRPQERRPEITKRSHNSALSRMKSEVCFEKTYLQFDWHVRHFESPIVLGDVGPVAVARNRTYQRVFFDPEQVVAVALPIASHEVLIGSNGSDIDSLLTEQALNRASAELSQEFFVSSRNSAAEANIGEAIGTRARLYDEAEMAAIEPE